MAQETLQGMKATTDYVAERGQSDIDELRRQVKELTEKYGTMAQNTFGGVRDSMRRSAGDVEHQIRDKPVQAALIAAGVGFLIGAFIAR